MAARDEEGRVGDAVTALREAFPGAEVIVGDDVVTARPPRPSRARSSCGCRAAARARRLGGGGAARRETSWPRTPTCAATSAAPRERRGFAVGAFAVAEGEAWIARETSRLLIRLSSGYHAVAPLSGQRVLRRRARQVPLAARFGAETR